MGSPPRRKTAAAPRQRRAQLGKVGDRATRPFDAAGSKVVILRTPFRPTSGWATTHSRSPEHVETRRAFCVNLAGLLNIAVEKPTSEWARAIAPRFAGLAPAQRPSRRTAWLM